MDTNIITDITASVIPYGLTIIDAPVSSSISGSVLSVAEKRLKNLKPWPKGVSGNKKGKTKGAASLPAAIDRVLNREKIEAVANTVVETAISGSQASIEKILKLGGAPGFSETPVVTVNNNTVTVDTQTILDAIEFLKTKSATK